MIRPQLMKPGTFGVAADARRSVFDAHNESLVAKQSPVDAVFIGDSITDMWAIDAYFQGTHGVLVNRGIEGDITTVVRRRFAADVIQLRPRLVVIEIGVNNLWSLDIPLDTSHSQTQQEIEAEIITDISAMVKDALTHSIQVALSSLAPTNIPFDGNITMRNKIIQQVNERLKHIAHELQNVVFVDYHSHLVAEDGLTLRDGLADDGLHPHVIGYEIMANVLLNTLKEANVSILQTRLMNIDNQIR
ncbi:MAG: SGNH/GDSL hydrolase family protein [Ktedonobacteraceae bacterium]